ncbi:MAG: HDOD domain-containing protein [Clostridiaceae bacterium]|nr:HDOD domain-containing protein [Clostridiaceae bacterium]MBW4858940.1 HDOD domain-containing protein [Clostridiaceae bacterium]MBW4869515.1 HDOD domain-containing protein [Clostridiaceae bacterium]
MVKLTLDRVVEKVEEMPVLPNRINKIIEIVENPDSTVKDLENEILKDQSLTSKVLKLANTTHYGYPRKISTVSRATILLGFQTIKSIALVSTVSKYLLGELEGYALGKNDLWKQSQTCGIISRYIGKKKSIENPEKAYIAGLLRDIGKTILNHYVQSEYHEIVKIVEEERVPFLEAEKLVLGFDHAKIGSKVAQKWNFPKDLVEAIEYHHTPEKALENPELVSIVHVADAITMMMGVGLGVDGMKYNLSQFAIDNLKLNETEIQCIISEASDLIIDDDNFNVI